MPRRVRAASSRRRRRRTPPEPPSPPRLQDWQHDPSMRVLSSGTWAARYVRPPERADLSPPVDSRELTRRLLVARAQEEAE